MGGESRPSRKDERRLFFFEEFDSSAASPTLARLLGPLFATRSLFFNTLERLETLNAMPKLPVTKQRSLRTIRRVALRTVFFLLLVNMRSTMAVLREPFIFHLQTNPSGDYLFVDPMVHSKPHTMRAVLCRNMRILPERSVSKDALLCNSHL